MSRTGYLLITLLLLVLIRVPALFLWNNYLTGNDAAIYMEKAIHLTEGKGMTCSICRFISDRDDLKAYIAKFGNTTQELKVAPIYIYLLSGIYKVTGEHNFLLAINLLNLLLFIASLAGFFTGSCPCSRIASRSGY